MVLVLGTSFFFFLFFLSKRVKLRYCPSLKIRKTHYALILNTGLHNYSRWFSYLLFQKLQNKINKLTNKFLAQLAPSTSQANNCIKPCKQPVFAVTPPTRLSTQPRIGSVPWHCAQSSPSSTKNPVL